MGEHDPHNNQHLLHYHNQNQGQGQQQRHQPLALPAPKPELRRTKSDTSSMVETSRALKRKVSFRERPGSVVGIGVQDTESTVLSVSDTRAAPAKRGKSYSPSSDVGSSFIVGAVSNKWLGRTEAQQKKVKPKGGTSSARGLRRVDQGREHAHDGLGAGALVVGGGGKKRVQGEGRGEVGGGSMERVWERGGPAVEAGEVEDGAASGLRQERGRRGFLEHAVKRGEQPERRGT